MNGPNLGTLYFIQAGDAGPVKVGWTSLGALNRLSYLQWNHYETLNLLHARPGTREDERRLLERYAEYRVRGEWFDPIVLELEFGEDAVLDLWLDAKQAPNGDPRRRAS